MNKLLNYTNMGDIFSCIDIEIFCIKLDCWCRKIKFLLFGVFQCCNHQSERYRWNYIMNNQKINFALLSHCLPSRWFLKIKVVVKKFLSQGHQPPWVFNFNLESSYPNAKTSRKQMKTHAFNFHTLIGATFVAFFKNN